ncbi:hypothetical protein BFU36_09115 [Sulfolobus sp. A20]|nr:hypothetical protein BFU36_09115 [Sulfolobus sp. A20]
MSDTELEDHIIKIARTLNIFNFRAYNISIVSDYQKFLELILPKNVTNILVVLPLDGNRLVNQIKEAISKVRPASSLTIMYSKNINQKMYIGYCSSTDKVTKQNLDSLTESTR